MEDQHWGRVPRRTAFSAPLPAGARAPARRARHAQAPVCALRAGDVVEGRVASVARYGAFVELPEHGGVRGLVHISELSHSYVADVGAVVRAGDRVRVRVLDVGARGIGLSMKRAKRSYEEDLAEGADWGHPWGDDPDRPTRWADMGAPPPATAEVWEAGAPYRRKLQ